MNPSICVLCPYGADAGLISKAVSLSGSAPVRVLIPEADTDLAASAGAGVIHTLAAVPQDENQLVPWLKDKLLLWECDIILAPADIRMRNLMPMLAWQLGAGLTADCTELSLSGDSLLQTRPAFGNNLIATIRTLSPIQMATVRPGNFRYVENRCSDPAITNEAVDADTAPVSFEPFTGETPLSQASIIVAGGLGIGSKEGFQKLEQLAARLGGTVAASRSAVDAGFAPYRAQVGMTGVTVCPKLYIAVGISGAVQHLAGMSGSAQVIAINSDPKAPIFDYADYSVVANWETVIDKLLEVL